MMTSISRIQYLSELAPGRLFTFEDGHSKQALISGRICYFYGILNRMTFVSFKTADVKFRISMTPFLLLKGNAIYSCYKNQFILQK